MHESFPAAVLFADISGFTPLAEALAQSGEEGPEEMTRLLNAYFSRLIAAIEAEGGEVVKFSGDAVTVLFLARTAPLGYAARRATQAAVAMHALMDEFATLPTSVGPIALAVKIGIGVGTVSAFRVGGVLERWEYVVAGDPLRQVAEAEHAASRGETILSPEAMAVLAEAATPAVLPAQPLRMPVPSPDTDLEAAQRALRGFIPGAIRAWLGDRFQAWRAELRSMSVLFMGVHGLEYTAANALERLHSFLAAVQEAIYRYEGSLNKLAVDDKGTIVLAMFGAPPFAHADDAARAVQAARDLLALSEAHGLDMALGVATGPVFAGPVGSVDRREYTVMGDAVNRAARLMAAAGPGDMRCDFATARDARRVLAFESLPPVHLKGKANLVRVYRPIGLTRSEAQMGTALVGRQAEVQRLRAALDDLQAGRQRVLVLIGEAGLGKSRLVDELTLLARAQGCADFTGAGVSSERQTPYRAWREVFTSYFGLDGADAPMERRRLVQAQVAALAPEHGERLPLLNDLLGTDFPETSLTAALTSERRYQSRANLLIDLLCRRAATQPLVLILDDAHWLDTRSWGLALAVAQGLRAARLPLLLVLSMRPLETPERPLELAALLALDGAEQMTLGALSPDDTVALAAALLGLTAVEIPPAVAALVRARAEGNPFFAEEMLLALRDQGVLEVVEEGGQRSCVLLGDITEATRCLPDTVQGVILSRLDQLTPEEQMLLRVGAVIGRRFSYHALRTVFTSYLTLADTEIKARLELLADLDLTPEETPDPNLHHAFRHLITQEVAYGTMLFTQRRELHRMVAVYYEARFDLDGAGPDTGEDPAALGLHTADIVHRLAYHYQQAGDVERERYYAALAGELAAQSFANAEALTYLDRALALTPVEETAAQRRLLLLREQVHDVLANRQAQEADLAALEVLSDPDDYQAQAELAVRQAHYYLSIDQFPRALADADRAATLAQAAAWPTGETMARRLQGADLIPLARYDEASAQLHQALALARVNGITSTEDDCLRDLGLIAYYHEQYATARDYYAQALALAQAIGDRRGESATLVRLATVLRELGEYTPALAYYERALTLDRATGDRDDAADAQRGMGLMAYAQGHYAAARLAYEESLASEREAGDCAGQAACLAALGMTARALGDFAAAQAALEEALAISQAIGDRRCEATIRADMALLSHQCGDNRAARPQAQAALALATGLSMRAVAGTALTRLGHALYGLGEPQGAATAYQAALYLHHKLDAHTLALEPLAGLARLARARGDLSTARGLVDALLLGFEAQAQTRSDERPQMLLCCYEVLHALHDPRAGQVLAMAYKELEHQAAHITHPVHQHAFWEDVPAHRALCLAYRVQTC
jgi:predicted ATPase/class 3 adenylate cyclase